MGIIINTGKACSHKICNRLRFIPKSNNSLKTWLCDYVYYTFIPISTKIYTIYMFVSAAVHMLNLSLTVCEINFQYKSWYDFNIS